MTINEALESAQGGNLFDKLARMTGLSASDCRAAMAGLGAAIAARIQETARDPVSFDQLLDMLEDNEGDLLADGDLASRDTEEDGQGVLVSAYGSEQAAGDEAGKTAKALRLDESAVRRLMPVAAALVLAVLARRHKELAGPVLADEIDATDDPTPPQTSASRQSGGGILSVLLAAIGAGIARAIANRLLPRRRRRYSYPRRRRRRQPSLPEIFRGLLR